MSVAGRVPMVAQHTVTIGTEITQTLRPSTEKSSLLQLMKLGQTFFTSTTISLVPVGTLILLNGFVNTCVIRSQPRSFGRWALLIWVQCSHQ
jgi:hypothetical protein